MIRLLPKYEIDKKLAEEQRQKMEEGMKIADRVDTLRETLASEEQSFEKYRVESLKEIQNEIHLKIHERDVLVDEVVRLEQRKKEAERPVDLVEEWQKVGQDRLFLVDKQEELNEREDFVVSREKVILSTSRDLLDREERLMNKERLGEAYFIEAENSNKRAKKLEKDTEIAKNMAENEIKERYSQLHKKEKYMKEYEFNIQVKEKVLHKREKELENGWKLLKDRQGMLERDIKRMKK